MKLYTIGFTQKDARTFFELLKKNQIELLIDIRLNNASQLAGFTKGRDLEYFLKEIAEIRYIHNIRLAPTKDILDDYKKKRITWGEYEKRYNLLIETRKTEKEFANLFNYNNICLLCSEPDAKQCHRRLLAEYLQKHYQEIEIIHI